MASTTDDPREELLVREPPSPRTPLAGKAVRSLLVVAGLLPLAVLNHRALLEHPEAIVHHDAAGHLLPAYQIAAAASSFDPLGMLARIYEQDRWPFLLSLWLTPFVLAGGYSWQAAALGVVAAWFLAGLALFWTVRSWARRVLEGKEALWDLAGALALLLYATSPRVNLFSTEVMLEVPAMFLAVLIPHGYAAARLGKRDARRFCLSLTLLFFLKFNYGLYALAAVLALEGLRWWRWEPGRSIPGAALAACRHPLTWITLAGVVLAAVLLKTGGFEGSLFGKKFSITSPGHPLYLVFLAWLLWMAPRIRPLFASASLRPLVLERAFVLWTALPIALWLIHPTKFRNIVHWALRGGGYIKATREYEPLRFPRAILEEYSLFGAVGAAVLVLGLGLGLVVLLRAMLPSRRPEGGGLSALEPLAVVALMFLLPCALVRNLDDRMLMPGIAFLWSLAALALAFLAARIGDRKLGRGGALLAWVLPAVLAVGWMPGGERVVPEKRDHYGTLGENSSLVLAEKVVDLAGEAPSCGFFSEVFYVDHKLLELTRLSRPGLRRRDFFTGEVVRDGSERKLSLLLERRRPARVVVLFAPDGRSSEADPSRGYHGFMGRRADYAPAGKASFPEAGLEAVVYDRR